MHQLVLLRYAYLFLFEFNHRYYRENDVSWATSAIRGVYSRGIRRCLFVTLSMHCCRCASEQMSRLFVYVSIRYVQYKHRGRRHSCGGGCGFVAMVTSVCVLRIAANDYARLEALTSDMGSAKPYCTRVCGHGLGSCPSRSCQALTRCR